MIYPLNLPALRALWEAATSGRWVEGLECVYVDTGHAVGDPDAPDSRVVVGGGQNDLRWIAAAHNAFPALLTAAEERERYRKALIEIRLNCEMPCYAVIQQPNCGCCACLATAALESKP